MNNQSTCFSSLTLCKRIVTSTLNTFVVLSFLFVINVPTVVKAQENAQASYIQTITKRANKIVADLGITDSTQFYAVQNILINQYSLLNSTHEGLNAQIKSIKKDTTISKEIANQKIAALEGERKTIITGFHANFIASLSKLINADQITKIKDGMTYNKVAVTYNGYIAMVPSLTDTQKAQIKTYLEEAREFAVDAESSEKKTEWFGKYKGRINNYLAAQGYDLKKEGDEWQARIKQAKENKQ